MKITTWPGFCIVLTFVGSLLGCASQTEPSRGDSSGGTALNSAALPDGPDRSLFVDLRDSPSFKRDRSLEMGGLKVFESVKSPGDRFFLSFEPRSAETGATLDEYMSRSAKLLIASSPGKVAVPMTIPGGHPIDRAGLAWRAESYPTQGREQGASVCDAAAIRFQSPAGFWTVSWNFARGSLESSRAMAMEFLNLLVITKRAESSR